MKHWQYDSSFALVLAAIWENDMGSYHGGSSFFGGGGLLTFFPCGFLYSVVLIFTEDTAVLNTMLNAELPEPNFLFLKPTTLLSLGSLYTMFGVLTWP